jgi:hypothetical protein
MEPEVPVACSQGSATGPCPELVESGSYSHILFLSNSF